jgi:hypothetical protein
MEQEYERNRLNHESEILEQERSVNFVFGDLNKFHVPSALVHFGKDQMGSEVVIRDQYNQIVNQRSNKDLGVTAIGVQRGSIVVGPSSYLQKNR